MPNSTAQNIDGVVIVFYTDKETLPDFIRTLKEHLKEYGYDASWGCRYQSDSTNRFTDSIE